jgi:hypothetical protein
MGGFLVLFCCHRGCMKSPTSWHLSNGESRSGPTAEDAGEIGPLVLWPEAWNQNGLVMTLPSHRRGWLGSVT